MKERLEEFKKVVAEYSKFENEFHSLVRETAREFVKYEKLKYPRLGWPCNGDIDNWVLENDGKIWCEWEENWSYGGHDQGTFDFPAEFLVNPEAFNQYKKECVEFAKVREDKEKQDKLNSKKREFEKLKKELEQG